MGDLRPELSARLAAPVTTLRNLLTGTRLGVPALVGDQGGKRIVASTAIYDALTTT